MEPARNFDIACLTQFDTQFACLLKYNITRILSIRDFHPIFSISLIFFLVFIFQPL